MEVLSNQSSNKVDWSEVAGGGHPKPENFRGKKKKLSKPQKYTFLKSQATGYFMWCTVQSTL